MKTVPTRRQVEIARATVEWYLTTHYGKSSDVGLVGTFCDPHAVGHFAVERAALQCGDDGALFRLLVTVAMFQRLRDELVKSILRGISQRDAEELSSLAALCSLAATSECKQLHANATLVQVCDLTKNVRRQGVCTVAPTVRCHVKRHTELLRRYGHFGKMPTSAALVIANFGGLTPLYMHVLGTHESPLDRAQALEREISQAWRVSVTPP